MRGMTLTVGQLNEYVRRSLASDPMLHSICLTGEISNFKRHASGHWYFTLKDEEAAINCAMFRQSAITVRFRPENGQRVRLFGSVGLYTKTGAYQFYADAMEPDGVGDLYLQFEALKRKLSSEGLFDASLKKPIPLFPRGVGIVTSKTGAVVHDIARVSWRRFPGMPLYLCPVKVQGEGAAREIANGLMLLDAMPEVDVIIVGRGGGSMEDLWPFNEEAVARAIALCQTPVISAVGHETDFTIADFVADLRAATPSAAAELAVPERETLIGGVDLLANRMEQSLEQTIAKKQLQLARLENRMSACSPEQQREKTASRLAEMNMRMDAVFQKTLADEREKLVKGSVKLDATADQLITRWLHRLERAELKLRASGPVETMKRGYAIVTSRDGLIRSAKTLDAGARLQIHLADGSVRATVDDNQNA